MRVAIYPKVAPILSILSSPKLAVLHVVIRQLQRPYVLMPFEVSHAS